MPVFVVLEVNGTFIRLTMTHHTQIDPQAIICPLAHCPSHKKKQTFTRNYALTRHMVRVAL
jgi:hypothetical protein